MLRHTFATNLVTSDVGLKTTQEIIRHSNIVATTSIYAHIKDEQKLNTLNNVFETKSVEKQNKASTNIVVN